MNFLLALIVLPVSTVWSGWVFSVLWRWFITPTFGFRALTLVEAVGVAIIIWFVTHQIDNFEDPTKSANERFATSVAQAFMKPLIYLAMGWVAHRFQ